MLSQHIAHISMEARHSRTERCGLIYGERLIVCHNIAVTPEYMFVMDPKEQIECVKKWGWPEYIWHTHPGGTYGLSDRDKAQLPLDTKLAVGVPDGRVGVWLGGELVEEHVWKPRLSTARSLNTKDTLTIYSKST